MTVVLTSNDILEKLVKEIDSMDELEQKFLLAKLRAQRLKRNGWKTSVEKPLKDISAETLTKWKHAARIKSNF
ncbi:MAG: hypothetical protein KF900_12625 [Bacteroidetes bacterium]|nr:hypothetical protein [Bacteroidota bacterium]